MSDDEHDIRALIERWAPAVHAGDLDTVLADHSDDIVVFDVPPPQDGVREIVELDVTAGADVAFAFALLRCNTPEGLASHPTQRLRLRLTLGLNKEDGRGVVAHEHHSFPDEIPVVADDERAVREVHRRWAEDTAAGDLDGLVAGIAAHPAGTQPRGAPG